MRFLPLALFAAASATPALAQDVALLFTFNPPMTSCWETDPQDKLNATGQFSSVTTIDVGAVTPTLAQLQAFDAVLVAQDFPGFLDGVALGDVLADYVDGGGGVVIAGFVCFSNWDPLAGRWDSGGYKVILSGGQTGGNATLGTVFDPSHPAMAGVASLDGGNQAWRPMAATLQTGATRIADWSDGSPLVAQGANPLRVDLGIFPPSSDCYSDGWVSTTDGAALLAGALNAVLGGGSLGTSYCGPAVVNSTGLSAAISASGSDVVADNNFSVTGSDLPVGQFAYVIAAQAQVFVPNAGGSQGTLCVGSPSVRFTSQVGAVDGSGRYSVVLDLPTFPQNPVAPVNSGETWNFQIWNRDVNPMTTSNFTDAVSVLFI